MCVHLIWVSIKMFSFLCFNANSCNELSIALSFVILDARVFKEAFEDSVTYVTSTIVADCQDLAETLAAVRDEALQEESDEEEKIADEELESRPKQVKIEEGAESNEADVAECLGKLTVGESTTGEAS